MIQNKIQNEINLLFKENAVRNFNYMKILFCRYNEKTVNPEIKFKYLINSERPRARFY